MVSTFTELFQYLNSLDVLNSLLPFLLVFAVVYAILQKSQIFGIGKKNINVIFALVMALSVVLPHILYGGYGTSYVDIGGTRVPDAVNIINSALPQVSIVVIAIILVMLLLGIFGYQASWVGGVQGWMVFICLAIVAYIFGNSAGWWTMPSFLYFLNDSSLQTALIVILVFGLIIWAVTAEEGTAGGKVPAKDAFAGIGKTFNELFGGGKGSGGG